jgi:hypothetical protein
LIFVINAILFFTGEQRFVDVQGRVERFQSKQKAITTKPCQKTRQKRTPAATRRSREKRPKTLREMLNKVKN